MNKKQSDETAISEMTTEGHLDFDMLPENVKAKVLDSCLGAGQSWAVLTKGLEEEEIAPEQKLKARRALKGLSQSDLAELAGIRQADVSKIEKNHKKVSLEVLEKCVHSLGLTLKDVLGKELA